MCQGQLDTHTLQFPSLAGMHFALCAQVLGSAFGLQFRLYPLLAEASAQTEPLCASTSSSELWRQRSDLLRRTAVGGGGCTCSVARAPHNLYSISVGCCYFWEAVSLTSTTCTYPASPRSPPPGSLP